MAICNLLRVTGPHRLRKGWAGLLAGALLFLLSGCSSPGDSLLLYRLPYADGTNVCVGRDHLTHTPQQNRFDLGGTGGDGDYRVVAAATGVVRIIRDDLSQNCCSNPTCGNNYVWIQHIGGEWTKYSHLATNSARQEAGLEEGDVVIAGTFIGRQSDVGRACSRCGSNSHLHFEVGVPTDPANPISSPGAPNNGGFLVGTNPRARFCNVPAQTLVQGREEVAARCDPLLTCLRSHESPSTEGQCEPGLSGDVCVRDVNAGAVVTYVRGTQFSSSAVKIDLDWCGGPNCDPADATGRGVVLAVVAENGDVSQTVLNCNNRNINRTFTNVQQISIEGIQGLDGTCSGNTVSQAFARWEICEVPALLVAP